MYVYPVGNLVWKKSSDTVSCKCDGDKLSFQFGDVVCKFFL